VFHAAVARLRARRPLWAIYPTRRFGVAILAAGALWLIPGGAGRAIASVAAALLVVAAAFDYARLAPSRRVTVVRDAPASIGLGDVSELSYTLRSDWPWALRVEVFDTLPSGLSTDARLAPVPLAARDTRTVTLPVTGVARGSQVLGDVALRSTTPLGLVARLGRPPMPVTSIAVVPSLRNVRRYRLLAMQHRLSDAGIRALKQRGEGTSVAGLRDYVPGDDPRLLDWKASARHSRLITRELSIERSQTVISLIDCGRAMTQSAGRFSRFEHVLSSSLLLADVAVTSGDRVGLIAFDDRIRAVMAPSRGTGALALVRSTLSGLDASLTEPDYASAFRTLATRQRRRALVVFFTDVIDVRVAKQFAAYAGRAARRHAMIIVAIQNEALLEATRTNASGSLALYRRAAAEELVREREEALARMRQAGVTVLDVAPDRMATAVVNRYLELKAKGSI
jgi:uncharacterized protein (DUF58 family)